jgi:DNA-binding beta-propeller fold protein YncE
MTYKLSVLALGICLLAFTACNSSSNSTPAAATPAAAPAVTFQATDSPGSWFECANTSSTASVGCVPESIGGLGQKSLAIIAPGEAVGFVSTGQAATLHTAVSLMFPTGAANMPYDIGTPMAPPSMGGSSNTSTVTLNTPGLYVFFCDIHPYMFAAVIVDDPATVGFDLGKTVDLPHVSPGGIAAAPNGVQGLPTASNLVLRLVHTFFIATNPHNWQSFASSGTAPWSPSYPPVPVLASADGTTTVSVPDLNIFLQGAFSEPKTLPAIAHPVTAGVGEIWVDTQFESIQEKSKPGTATAVSATTFAVTKKIALPDINMNNPHNMWTDKDQTVIYQTQWFDNTLAVFNRTTGALVRNINVGPAPAHVMTRTTNDQVHVSQNAGNNVRELDSYLNFTTSSNGFIKDIPMSIGGDVHPHAHWMSADGSMMVTPNEDSENSTLYSFNLGAIAATTTTGHGPIATGMMPDSSKYYVANFLDSTLSVLTLTGFPSAPSVDVTKTKTINLLGTYNPVTGLVPSGFVGALPIQTPVSPDGRFVATANTLTATILIINTATDTVVASVGCDPGCHGVQWGAKAGGGYYAYVSSKFSNRMLVVDPDPNGFGVAPDDGSNAVLAGSILLAGVGTDGTVVANSGMGGQGILPIPVVYNGWVQNLPVGMQAGLTAKQLTATK